MFYQDFRESINFKKPSLMVSRNVNDGLARTLSNNLNVPLTKNVGKYLGVPSNQARVTT